VLGQDGPDGRGASVGRVLFELALHRVQVEQFQCVGLVERPLHRAPRYDRGQVNQGARHAGTGDAVDAADVLRGERGRAVDLDAVAAAADAPRHGHVDVPPLGVAQADQRRGVPVREHGVLAAGQYRRHPPALAGEKVQGDHGVHASEDAMQGSAGGTVLNGARGQSELYELR